MTLGGGGMELCHKITQGRGRGSAKVSRDIFSKKCATFWYFCPFKTHSFLKNLSVVSHTGGGYRTMSPKDTRGGGGLKLAKKVSRIIWMAPYLWKKETLQPFLRRFFPKFGFYTTVKSFWDVMIVDEKR